ncbi:MAG: magnesium/cobalt transporter CorA [Bacteroidota bacterium]
MDFNKYKYSQKQGLPPGSLIHTGEVYEKETLITLISYNNDEYIINETTNIDEIFSLLRPGYVNWINITGLQDVTVIEKLGKYFNLHNLMLEDILNTHHLPKAEDYGKQLFFTMKSLDLNPIDQSIDKKQLSFVLDKDYLITFQETKSSIFDPIIERIKHKKGRVRTMKNDYLFYALLDVTVDSYFVLIEYLDDQSEEIEEELLNNPSRAVVKKIQQKRKEHLFLKKAIYPLQDEIRKIFHLEEDLIQKLTHIYFQDIIDHLQQIVQSLESFREIVSNLLELYLANNDIQMNDVMKRLTVVSTIFIPLTFIVGLYGMNFKDIPEIQWQHGYIYVWLVMIGITVFVTAYLKKRKWF